MFASIVSHPSRARSEGAVFIFPKGGGKALRRRAFKTENYNNYVIYNTESCMAGKYDAT